MEHDDLTVMVQNLNQLATQLETPEVLCAGPKQSRWTPQFSPPTSAHRLGWCDQGGATGGGTRHGHLPLWRAEGWGPRVNCTGPGTGFGQGLEFGVGLALRATARAHQG